MLRRLALGLYLTTTITAVAWADGSDECLQSKDHQLSIKACGELIAGKQATALIYNRRGEAYRGTQQLDLAIADHTKAIELAPDEPAGYNNRCATRTQAGDFDGAVADCDKAIHVNPSYVSAYFNRRSRTSGRGITTSLSPTMERRSNSIRNMPAPTMPAPGPSTRPARRR